MPVPAQVLQLRPWFVRATGCVALGLALWATVRGMLDGTLGASALLVITATASFGVGLVLDRRWARRGTAALALFLAVLLPIAVFNPYTAGDLLAQGRTPGAVSQTLVWMLPLEVALVLAAWLLDLGAEHVQVDHADDGATRA